MAQPSSGDRALSPAHHPPLSASLSLLSPSSLPHTCTCAHEYTQAMHVHIKYIERKLTRLQFSLHHANQTKPKGQREEATEGILIQTHTSTYQYMYASRQSERINTFYFVVLGLVPRVSCSTTELQFSLLMVLLFIVFPSWSPTLGSTHLPEQRGLWACTTVLGLNSQFLSKRVTWWTGWLKSDTERTGCLKAIQL